MKSGAFVNLMTEDKQIDELRDLLSIGEVTEDNKIAFSQTAVMEVDELLPHTQRITRDAGYKQLLEDLKIRIKPIGSCQTVWKIYCGLIR